MSDNRSRHDRLAVRLSLIISRLMAGESLSLKTLSDEFGVTERTLQRDFHQRLVHLDLEYRNGRYSLRRQSSPGAIPEMLSFIQNITVTQNSPTGQTMTTDAEAAVSEALRGLAFWLYRQLENEYDWLTSDAAVDEALLINEYTFTEAGLRAG
ncbi:HTH domain-containing protein [Escherichia coli]|nr:HTH domain-containing protein [Escherichia coli]